MARRRRTSPERARLEAVELCLRVATESAEPKRHRLAFVLVLPPAHFLQLHQLHPTRQAQHPMPPRATELAEVGAQLLRRCLGHLLELGVEGEPDQSLLIPSPGDIIRDVEEELWSARLAALVDTEEMNSSVLLRHSVPV